MPLPAKLNAKAVKLIEGKNFAFLATIMPDGAPHVAPVWIDREGDTILVNTTIGRVKQRNVTTEPRVALSVADQNNMYDKIVIRGRVTSDTRRCRRAYRQACQEVHRRGQVPMASARRETCHTQDRANSHSDLKPKLSQ
jgi:PPOX class probable F420-dependent enzyme